MKTPIRLAIAAVVAQAPRLLLSLAGIYGAPIGPNLRLGLASVSALASAAVLTGGCAYLAHAVAVTTRNRATLALFWGLTGLVTVTILAPEIVAVIPSTHLAQVLHGPAARWAYAVALASFAELVASGLAVAAASLQPDASDAPESDGEWAALNLSGATHMRASNAPAEPMRATCEKCGGTYRATPQGFSAHSRWCGRKGAEA